MPGGWEKMARWAGLGNNERDNMTQGEEMSDELKDGAAATQEQPAGVHTMEAGTEGHAEELAGAAMNPSETELLQLRGERDQLQDRLARLQAEFDNARKRSDKERQDVREYTVGSTVEPFLGVLDNFGLALKAQGSAEQLRSGVELIVKQMDDALKSLNVLPVETVGAQFDPRVHEALGSIETAEFPDHQVLEEIRKGYKLRDKLLRPALVKIASNTAQVSE